MNNQMLKLFEFHRALKHAKAALRMHRLAAKQDGYEADVIRTAARDTMLEAIKLERQYRDHWANVATDDEFCKAFGC